MDTGIGFAKIVCNITDFGVKHGLYFIIYLIFQYIYISHDHYNNEEWVLKELMEIHALKFNNHDDYVSSLEYAQDLSISLQTFPFEDILTSDYIHEHGNPEHKGMLLEYMRPDNMNIIVVSKQSLNETAVYKTEKYFGAHYSVNKIPDNWIQIWSKREYTHKLVPLQRNEFLPRNFEVYPLGEGEPEDPYIICKSSKLEIWFKQDDKFRDPVMWLDLEICSSTANLSPFNVMLLSLFVDLLTSSLEEEYLYFTSNVFLVWSLTVTDCGLRVHTFGFNDKLPIILEKILLKIVNYGNDTNDDDKAKFATLKRQSLKSVQEILRGEQTDQATWLTEHLINGLDWPAESLLQAIYNLKFEDLKKFANRAFRRIFIRGLIHGNCTNTMAKEIVNMVEEYFQSSDGMLQQEMVLRKRVKIADDTHFIYPVTSGKVDFNGYSSFFPLQTAWSREFQNVKSFVLTEIISSHCVASVIDDDEKEPPVIKCTTLKDTNGDTNGTLGFLIKVQSKKRSPHYMNKKVERFLDSVREYISNMTVNELESHKTAVAMNKYKRPAGFKGLSEVFWNEITNRRYDFKRSELEVLLLYSVMIEDMEEFFQQTFGVSSPRRRKLAVHIFPKGTEKNKLFTNHVSPMATLVKYPHDFKTSSSLLALELPPDLSPVK